MFARVRASLQQEVERVKAQVLRSTIFGALAGISGLVAIGFAIAAGYIALADRIGEVPAALVIAGIFLLIAVGCALALSGGKERSRGMNLTEAFKKDVQEDARYIGDQARAQVQSVATQASVTARQTVDQVTGYAKDAVRGATGMARSSVDQVTDYARESVDRAAGYAKDQVAEAAHFARASVDEVSGHTQHAVRSTVSQAAGAVDTVVRSIADEFPGPVRDAFLMGARALPQMRPWQLVLVAGAAGFFYARRARRH